MRHFVPVLKIIAETPDDVWGIDICTCSARELEQILTLEREISRALSVKDKATSVTLTTKVMLGVFGNVPAIDTFVFNSLAALVGIRAYQLDRVSASAFADFYVRHKPEIDRAHISTLDFSTGQPTKRLYPTAKKVDMILFTAGQQATGTRT
ncbi:hypothetical protein [Deinococcus ficus]|uniref:hypothetical protein n=1 Tax=Deinococcus ficus TaxID=317577 RepID=UPI00131C6B4B|nr:hypothetical protein [Deinococcus ficus]